MYVISKFFCCVFPVVIIKPIENEAVVCELLRIFSGRLRLVEIDKNNFKGLKYREGNSFA